MSFLSILRVIFLAIYILLTGCSSAPILNIEESSFKPASSANLSQIKRAIIKACEKAGWSVTSRNSNKIFVTYSYKRNKFNASARVDYDRDSYSITYISSQNLKYVAPRNTQLDNSSGDIMSDSKNFFSDNNPFNQQKQHNNTQKSARIHKRYNQWVRALDNNIMYELNNIGHHNAPYSSAKKENRNKATRSLKNTTICHDQSMELAYGQASITTNKVNLRSGASTNCSITGSVNKSDMLTLLGRKNNWYYIELNGNKKSWIYAPLVKMHDNNNPIPAPTASSVSDPALKNISIAVIKFKTLNKEAQKISLGDLISETFTSALVNSRSFKIIEREQLDKVVKEMEMNQTGFIETTDAVEIGKMLHADAIITGSVALLNNQIQLNARIIEIESAYVISAETKTTQYSLSSITNIVNQMVTRLSRKLISANNRK